MSGDLELFAWDTADDNVAQRQTGFQRPAILFCDCMSPSLDTRSSVELLNVIDVH